MKNIITKINEDKGSEVYWHPQDYKINKSEDAIDLIAGLFEASTVPEILADAFEEDKFDHHMFANNDFLKKLGKTLGDIYMEKYDELYG
jgi:hypothetical protein